LVGMHTHSKNPRPVSRHKHISLVSSLGRLILFRVLRPKVILIALTATIRRR
jgi:hypothetical protein